ncbi:hypothetical protein LY01_02415 [Nonlabens xylanidelens]|uniref:Uncharacterized protein n=1 Tax=Nonlabens xylanidelens TaxID=191564 RepID=A0A2S6IHE6_9FLAO|nr:hypothetical protein [Nonlabens xylanidelens]PPK93632.1 hypothetical protein LY01_02415 [Nonlabens xylanidelens]PQJ17785.1 hypothetical protein BST94_12195 [Nonlabens xylanidelens]
MRITYIVIAIILLSCNNSLEDNNSMKIKYFHTWSGYSHPINPIGEMLESDVKTYKFSYYIASYDDEKLVSFKKIYKKELMYEYKYVYNSESELIKVIIVDKDGVSKNISLLKD